MNVKPTQATVTEAEVDAVVVGAFADGSLSTAAAAVDEAAGGLLTRLIEQKEITGKANETVSVLGPTGVAAHLVLVAGLGDRDKFDRKAAYRVAGSAARKLAAKERKRVAFFLEDKWPTETAVAAVAGAMVGCHGQDLYRKEKALHPFEELLWSGDEGTIARGEIVGSGVNLTRQLINEPADRIYPETFAERASQVAQQYNLEIEVWDQAKLEAERCGSLLAVAKGSSRPPRLVIVRHQGGPQGAPLLALVGKGVTFDSGGLSLKPTDSMLSMKCDMSGAATVLGAMQTIARLNLPVNVIGLMGLVENMTGPAAMKLGDVLFARNGKTIEVHNTDAEGRLVLADVLAVAVDLGAAKIVDLATLTGACMVALGMDVAGLMSNHQDWCDAVAEAARTCGEDCWQLPMYSDYNELIKSDVADIKNVGQGRWGGAITAAKFLEEFVADKPWTHIDIAGPAYLDKPKSWVDAGASGCFVRCLVEIAQRWKG